MSLRRRRLATSLINAMIMEDSSSVSLQQHQYNRVVCFLGPGTKQSWSSTGQARFSVLVNKNAPSVRMYDSSSMSVSLDRAVCGYHQHQLIHTVLGPHSQPQPQQEAKVDHELPSDPPPPPPGMFATVAAMAAGAGGAVFVAAIGVWAVFQMAFWVAGRAATTIPTAIAQTGASATAQNDPKK